MEDVIKEVFEEFNKTRKNIEIPISVIKKNLLPYRNSIILYGAGSAGIAFLHYLNDIGISPAYFTDGDESKWGNICEGLLIIPPAQIIEKLGNQALVIVTINTDGKRYCKSFNEVLRIGGHSGVYEKLKLAGCTNIIDYTYFRRCHEMFVGDKYNLPSCSDVNNMVVSSEKIKEAYHLLSDDMSRNIFEKILRFRLIDDNIIIPTLSQDNQYFEYDLYNKVNDEAFVDCGAYNGITISNFLRNNKNFSNYYAFEPDHKNNTECRAYINGLSDDINEKIHLFELALYDSKGSSLLYNLNGPGSFLSDSGQTTVNSITLDEIIDNNRVSFIKMNIEGAELKALIGAKETIKKNSPILAIAGYHKTWDLWDIPLLINNYSSDYELYLRSYMNHISFVYYFVPKNRLLKGNTIN